ncbi:MAG TPA: HAD hydrolase family protein [Opitutaceae bacterium]|nr:HAD hydrolase family protein [Opitutaceae bacterium]
MQLSASDRELIRQVRLLVFDFDGVFTDNAVYVNQDGVETVRCWRSDGLGLSRLRETGRVEMLVVSTEENPVVTARCRKLKLSCFQGVADKAARMGQLAAERGLPLARVAYVGNDINDAGCLQSAGLPIVVADAHPDVRPLARLVTEVPGGFGAVREICDVFCSVLSEPR